jgi:hypothetical protein
MRPAINSLLTLLTIVIAPSICLAQCTSAAGGCIGGVPHFVKFGGVLKGEGSISHDETVAVKFVIYDDSTSGNALWQEVQNIHLNAEGRYEVMLGSTAEEGMPMDLFTSGEPRWLGAQVLRPGSEEQPRVLMVSVPYAMEAADAQTLGGLPASAFAKAAASVSTSATPGAETVITSSGTQAPAASAIESSNPVASVAATPAIEGRVGPVNVIPKFSGGGLTSSQITDAGGTVSMQNLSNILFADRFSGGVPDAVAACPANGCIIYALSPNVNLNLGSIDPGTKAMTIYLGPYTYSVQQITLRKALKIIGMGASGGVNGSPTCSAALPCNGTTLQSINGNNPVFVLPQTSNTPAANVLLSGFRLLGSAGNTSEDGFFLDASSTANSGLWFSTFDDIAILGFSGVSMHLRGRSTDFVSDHQWLLFNNLSVARPPKGGNALRLEGSIFEVRFRNCQFDGPGIGDGTNIYLGGFGGGTGGYPITVSFEGLISQAAANAVQIDGAVNLTFYNPHHEAILGAYQITNNTNIGTKGVTISDGYFAGNVGINSGAGYDLNVETTIASGIVFAHNQIFGPPDNVLKAANFASVVYQDNLYQSATTNVPPTSGITTGMSPATVIDIQGVHSIGLNPSTTPITTIQSGLGPGETVTFFTLAGSVTFGTGGNIDLMGMSSLTLTGTITFVRSDLGGLSWKVVSQWSPTSTSPTAQFQSTVAPGQQARASRRQ